MLFLRLVVFDLIGFIELSLKASPDLFLIFVVGIDGHFLVASCRDTLDQPTDLIINRLDFLKIFALFGLQGRMLVHHLIQKAWFLFLLLLLGLLSYDGNTFIFCSSKLLRSEKEGSRYLIAQPLPKVSPRYSGTSVTSDWKMDFQSIQRPIIVYIKFCTKAALCSKPTQIASQSLLHQSFSSKVKQLYSYNFIPAMDALLREKMTQLTSKCQILQKNGKYEQCIDIMEQIVSIKKNVYGLDHAEFQTASEKLCEYLNLAAMIHLQKENFQRTLEYLKKAEIVARESIMLKATTFNNLACYYRRTGKVKTAFSYLIKALELELKLDQPKTLADTHLNLCAVLSQLDRHDDALQHSMLSIILLQDEFLSSFLPKIRAMGNEEDINDERMAVLAIAYHNLGVEFQHLKRYEEALKIYRKALAFSKENLSSNEQLVKNLSKVVNSATQQIQEQKQSLLASVNKTMVMKEGSAFKHDFYKDLSKKNERYRPLPKLKVNTKEHAALYEPSYQSVDYNEEEPVNASKTLKNRQRFISQRTNTKQQNAITPDSRGQLDSQLKVRAGMNMTSHSKQPDLEQ